MARTNLVRRINERSVIDCMRDGKEHTKQELAGMTGLSFPTVGKLVEDLAAEGMLLRLGTAQESPGGRKAEVYRLNPDFCHILLLYLQGNQVFYRICNALGEVKSEGCRQGGGRQSHLLSFTGMDRILLECAKEAAATDGKIGAVSVGIPGSVHNGRICCIDGYPGLAERDLEKELADTLKGPAAVNNNMSLIAAGMAEKLHQGGEGTLVCLHLADTGPGMGAVVNGRPLQGFSGFQGEVGFMPLFGDRTIQEIAMDGFVKERPGECLGKAAACICTVLNPERMICYLEQGEPELRQEMVRVCERFLPAWAKPQFVFDRDYVEDYFHGLAVTGMELIYGRSGGKETWE